MGLHSCYFKVKKSCMLLIAVAAAVFLMSIFPGTPAASAGTEDDFFSEKRFELNPMAFNEVRVDYRAKNDLEKFYYKFLNAAVLIRTHHYEYAIKELDAGYRLWPEYFGTYFLLALAYEKEGNIKLASRHYKSYLIKLKDYYSGNYRISVSVIRVMFKNKVESLDEAEKKVRDHLAEYGLDLDGVRPAIRTANLWTYSLLVVLFMFIFLVGHGSVLPYLHKLRRLKNPPEGFWVCENCLAENPDLRYECSECRKPRDNNG